MKLSSLSCWQVALRYDAHIIKFNESLIYNDDESNSVDENCNSNNNNFNKVKKDDNSNYLSNTISISNSDGLYRDDPGIFPVALMTKCREMSTAYEIIPLESELPLSQVCLGFDSCKSNFNI